MAAANMAAAKAGNAEVALKSTLFQVFSKITAGYSLLLSAKGWLALF
jgi:hypothetical protein